MLLKTLRKEKPVSMKPLFAEVLLTVNKYKKVKNIKLHARASTIFHCQLSESFVISICHL